MNAPTLRYYQRDLIEAVERDWAASYRCVAAELPTGGGKSVVFAEVARRSSRTLVLAHREELVDQGVGHLRRALGPARRVGRMQGAAKEAVGVDACMAMVQTAATPGGLRAIELAKFTTLIVDECHHGVAPTYRRVMNAMPHARVLGVSATLHRGDRQALGEVFSKISYIKPITEMIREGWLVRPRGRHVFIEGMDLRKVARRGGDYTDGALAASMMEALAPGAMLRAWIEHAKGRPTIGFAPTVEMAYLLAETFRAGGVSARAVHGDQSAQGIVERRAAMAAFRRGEFEVLWNVGIATEGFNVPEVSCVIPRMTSSPVVYIQQVGRGLRLSEGKKDCLILDFHGVIGKHRLASLASLRGAASERDTPDELLEYENDIEGQEDERAETEPAATVLPEFVDGALSWAEIEMFEESAVNWLRTVGGTPFIRHGAHVTFPVFTKDGRVLLAEVPGDGEGGRWAGEASGYRDVVEAMVAAEKLIRNTAWVRRGEAWRGSEHLTLSLRERANEWGVAVSAGMTRGDVSDAVDIKIATRRIDHLPMVREGLE